MNIEHELKEIKKMLRELVRDKRKEEEHWINQKEAAELTGYSVEALRKMRRGEKPVLKRWRYLTKSKRNVQYDREELENLFTLNTNSN